MMKVTLDPDAKMPTRAHETDAGLDLYSRDDWYLGPWESKTFDTGVHVELPPGTGGLLVAKSGLNITRDLTSTGLIDETYTGSLAIKLYNQGSNGYMIRKGDKISQLVIFPVLRPELELVDKLEETGRGNNGFGSTGR